MRVVSLVGVLVMVPPGRAGAADPLPSGDMGIAAKYPGDAGIEGDPEVIFADDFEGYASADGLPARWDAAVFQPGLVRIATEPEHVFAGGQALEFTIPQQDAELSDATDRTVSPERDVLFLRYYSKFQPPYDVTGSSHNGSVIAAHYFIDGQATPGVPADGMNKFLVAYEHWRGEAETPSPGRINAYVYHPEQRSDYGDHFFPTGEVTPYSPDPFDFGPEFVPRPDVVPELDRWSCYEVMVQANTPGQRDGRLAFWFEGELAADFQNLRFRDVESLKIDRFGLSFHIGSNPKGEAKKWYDNVVAAGAYIGPMVTEGPGGTSGSGGETAGSTGGGGATSGVTGGAGSSGGPGEATGSETATGAATGGSGGAATGPATGGSGGEAGDAGCGCYARGPDPLVALGLLGLAVGRRRRARR